MARPGERKYAGKIFLKGEKKKNTEVKKKKEKGRCSWRRIKYSEGNGTYGTFAR